MIIVFGGAGFIGTWLLRALSKTGHHKLVSADIVEPQNPVSGVEYVFCDVRNPIELDNLGKAERIYDLAAVHRTPGHPDHEYYQTNIQGALNITKFAERIGCDAITFTSSIAVYGPEQAVKTEMSKLKAETAYGWSKLLAEQVYRSWAQSDDTHQLVITRPAVVFGPGENGNFTRLCQALKSRTFVLPGDGKTIKSCGYVEDLIASFAFMETQNEQTLVYNFCIPNPPDVNTICQAMRAIGLPKPIAKLPAFILYPMALGFEVLSVLGIKTSINRARINKLLRSTNIEPFELKARGFDWKFPLALALKTWAEHTKGQMT